MLIQFYFRLGQSHWEFFQLFILGINSDLKEGKMFWLAGSLIISTNEIWKFLDWLALKWFQPIRKHSKVETIFASLAFLLFVLLSWFEHCCGCCCLHLFTLCPLHPRVSLMELCPVVLIVRGLRLFTAPGSITCTDQSINKLLFSKSVSLPVR